LQNQPFSAKMNPFRGDFFVLFKKKVLSPKTKQGFRGQAGMLKNGTIIN
jgi:hypothetical protein